VIRATEAIGRYLICALALALAVAAKHWIAPVNATTAAVYMLLVQIGDIAFFDAAASQVYGIVHDSNISHFDLARVAETGETMVRGDTVAIPVRLGTYIIGSLATVSSRLSPTVRPNRSGALTRFARNAYCSG
jgi:hypothetical protein